MGFLRWIRPRLFAAGLAGLLALALPVLLTSAAPAAAEDGCQGDLAKRLGCWAGRVGAQNEAVVVTLHAPLALDGKQADWKLSERKTAFDRGPLVVLVPAGHPTGQGGTLLLVLAADRLVDPDAEITRLDDRTLGQLKDAGACQGAVCTLVAAGHQSKPLHGQDLLDAQLAARLDRNADNVGGTGDGSSLLPALGIAALLLVLLTAFVFVVRRSRGPRPAFAAPAAVHTESHPNRQPAHRAVPAARRRSRGRNVGGPSGPSRTAVVRTELHPQGYVELDDCLYRAVWAEPGMPAPAPGASVEVTEGRGRDAGVLYAYGGDATVHLAKDRAPHGS